MRDSFLGGGGVHLFLLSAVLLNQIVVSIQNEPSSTMTSAVDIQFASKTNEFALELYKQIISSENKNVVISPFSISTCLSLAAFGAAGQTASEMFSVLKYTDADLKASVADIYGKVLKDFNANPTVKIANKVYVMEKYSVKPGFDAIARKNFHSEAETVNFGESVMAAKRINGWVEQKTNDKIKNLIDPDSIDGSTRLVLVNAIHFKGTWKQQFDPEVTRPMPFWTTATESVDVPMMINKKHFRYGKFDELELSALELTYSDGDWSMLILLPNERDGLAKLEGNLQNIDVVDLLSRMSRQEVEVFLPRFKVEFDLDLTETLDKLGMGTMFTDKADFSELLEQPEQVKVSQVVHKAFIEVNEEGTEAAAATEMLVANYRYIKPKKFYAKQPFCFVLMNISANIILFNGHFRGPE
uniref:Putative serine proteinase inhibitor n=2 Tax=Culex tarsalis TaxID=7177 RepID=A0A1Q3FGW7_CULTA